MYLLSRDDNSSECNDEDEPAAELYDLDRTLPSTAEGSLITGCYNFIIIL